MFLPTPSYWYIWWCHEVRASWRACCTASAARCAPGDTKCTIVETLLRTYCFTLYTGMREWPILPRHIKVWVSFELFGALYMYISAFRLNMSRLDWTTTFGFDCIVLFPHLLQSSTLSPSWLPSAFLKEKEILESISLNCQLINCLCGLKVRANQNIDITRMHSFIK